MDSAICVIVPVYNRASLITATLESINKQTVAPRRLIIVDDGSTDDSASCVSAWLERQRCPFDCLLIGQANQGVAAARNRGLVEAADCQFVAFLDSDDVWPADFLERTGSALATTPSAVAATCNRLIFNRRRGRELHDLSSLAESPIQWMLTHGAGIASATLFRTAAIQLRGGFDESLATGEDTALFLPLSLEGPWLHVPGLPVEFDRGIVHQAGREGNLSYKFGDNYRRWAQVYEDFVVHGGGHRALAEADWRRLLGKAWYRAGRELASQGELNEARDCFHLSLSWNRWSIKTRQKLLGTFLRRMFQTSPAANPIANEPADSPSTIVPTRRGLAVSS